MTRFKHCMITDGNPSTHLMTGGQLGVRLDTPDIFGFRELDQEPRGSNALDSLVQYPHLKSHHILRRILLTPLNYTHWSEVDIAQVIAPQHVALPDDDSDVRLQERLFHLQAQNFWKVYDLRQFLFLQCSHHRRVLRAFDREVKIASLVEWKVTNSNISYLNRVRNETQPPTDGFADVLPVQPVGATRPVRAKPCPFAIAAPREEKTAWAASA
mmetsp:Transcript_108278/g.170744  ORF Transcript_108278/g.170744 Transcript_108278/m.170744 type:complete len:213 (-) Transcript_108278:287-925(-)